MIHTVFVLLLFGIFTGTIVLSLLFGAGAYQSIHRNMEAQYAERTGPAYLEAKLHHYDTADAVRLEPFADGTALALYEQVDGREYKTWVYYHEGYIKELFFEEGLELHPEAGQLVLKARAVSFQWRVPNLLEIVYVSEEGVQTELVVYLHSGEEVVLHA